MAELVGSPPTDPKVRGLNHRSPKICRQVSKLDHIVTVQHMAINNHEEVVL